MFIEVITMHRKTILEATGVFKMKQAAAETL